MVERQLESFQNGTGLVERQLSGRCTGMKVKLNLSCVMLMLNLDQRKLDPQRRFATCYAHD